MLKRLLTAVFVLSLILAFSGTAFADLLPNMVDQSVKAAPAKLDARKTNSVDAYGSVQSAVSANKKPFSEVAKLADGVVMPSIPSATGCGLKNYYGPAAPYYIWFIPDGYGDDFYNTRFTSDEGSDCALEYAHLTMFGGVTSGGDPGIVGNPDMRVIVWDTDGFGYPGTELASVVIPWATIDAELTAQGVVFTVTADFTADGLVFSDGEEYHIGWTIIDNSGAGTDVLSMFSDDGVNDYIGEGRSGESYLGTWETFFEAYDAEYSMMIDAEECCTEIPFSSCYTQQYHNGVAYYLRAAPHYIYGDSAYAQRFSVSGPETLVSVDIAVYDFTGFLEPGWFEDPGMVGNDDLYATVYADDGTGYPGAPIATVTVAGGTYPFFPSMVNFDFSGFGLVFEDDFHVAFSTSGAFGLDFEYLLADDGENYLGRSFGSGDPGWVGSDWYDMGDWWYGENFLINANLCLDEFALCNNQNNTTAAGTVYPIPDANPILQWAQEFSAGTGEACNLTEIGVWFYRHPDFDDVRPLMYTHNTNLNITTNPDGGALLHQIVLTPADYAAAGYTGTDFYGWFQVVVSVPNLPITGNFFIGVEPLAAIRDEGIRLGMDTDFGSSNAVYAHAPAFGGWLVNPFGWDAPSLDITARQCCIPFSEFTCLPGVDDDWSTYMGNYARTGRSNVSISDAWCDMTYDWSFEHPAQGATFTGPTVYGDYIIQAFEVEIMVFDRASGSPLYTISTGPPIMGAGIRTLVTAADIGLAEGPVFFVSGGDQQAVSCWDLATGAMVWTRDINTHGFAGLFGVVRYMPSIILDIAGEQVLYYTTEAGNVVALEATTGEVFTGWAVNPVALGQNCNKSGSTDGVSIFVGTYSAAAEGDIYSIDAATGVINWQLSAAGGLQATTIYGVDYDGGDEGFEGAAAYYMGNLYANSRCFGEHPVDGVFYRIDASNGQLIDGTASQSARPLTQSVTADINRCYVPTTSRWITHGVAGGASVIAFNRHSGAADFGLSGPTRGRIYGADLVLSCEPDGVADLLYTFDEDGFLICYNAEDGTPVYRRRIDNGGFPNSLGGTGALVADGTGAPQLVYATFYGNLISMSKGEDRARMEFYTYSPGGPIEFGALPSLIADLGPLFTNTGCTDLEMIDVIVNDETNGHTNPGFSAISNDDLNRVSSIANSMVDIGFVKAYASVEISDGIDVRANNVETNPAVSAFPTFINGIISPVSGQFVAPGEDVNLVVDVIQSAIFRGPQRFFIEFETNDPDFFLNDPTALPEVEVTLTGGCLIDTTRLLFGVGGANIQLATNTGRLGDGDWVPHGFEIDGDAGSYYQGSYLYGVSQHRVATHTNDWSGTNDALVSMQPDPNYCDNECTPALQAGVDVGAMWDGSGYAPMVGNIVCRSYLDSVQNFDDGTGTWDWTAYGAPFDNDSTMGLYVNARTIGVLDVPELANMTLEIMDITERNGNAVPGWRLAHFFDCDLGSDTVGIDQSFSAGWALDGGNSAAWGSIKIPFGECDGTPLINVVGLQGYGGFWEWPVYMDSAYGYCNLGPGDQTTEQMSDGDQQIHISIDAHDFAPNETYTVGVATFHIAGMADALVGAEIGPLAHMVNKWAGFGRGDVDNSGSITLGDIIYLAAYVNAGGNGPIPFEHLGDVNNDSAVDGGDVTFLIDYYFNCGACPAGDWVL